MAITICQVQSRLKMAYVHTWVVLVLYQWMLGRNSYLFKKIMTDFIGTRQEQTSYQR